LGQGYSILEAILPFALSVVGIVSLAAGIEGYFIWRVNWVGRVALIASGILFIFPTLLSSGIGALLLAFAFIPFSKKSIKSEENVSVA
jgi:TRAP-type uncharacterized transport system fused permease subunit